MRASRTLSRIPRRNISGSVICAQKYPGTCSATTFARAASKFAGPSRGATVEQIYINTSDLKDLAITAPAQLLSLGGAVFYGFAQEKKTEN